VRRRAARTAGLPVHLTGSGSTLFVVCPSRASAERVAAALSADLPSVATLVTRTI
jgi:4-diphosphocytidyl-2C-methyl-D-erythritol kinase